MDTGTTEEERTVVGAEEPDDAGSIVTMPERVGRYRMLEILGRGGMGVVYRAHDPELNRDVAVKVLRMRSTSGESPARLLREARALAKLAHPNVVHVYDVGADEAAGTMFVAMELVKGETLDAWLRRERPNWRNIVEIFVKAGEGLAAAHAVGLVHRDFKPANVMIDGSGQTRVLDFGLALAHGNLQEETPNGEWPTGDERVTQDGLILGTPLFMAPEQYRGREVDARADQYSFALSLFGALAGELPFRGLSARELLKAKQRPPTLPRNAAPRHVERALARAMHPRPDERYKDMEALLLELRRDPVARRRRVAGFVAAAGLAGLSVFGLVEFLRADESPCQGAEEALAGVWDDERRLALRTHFESFAQPYVATSFERIEAALDDRAHEWVELREDSCRATRIRGEQSEEIHVLRMACLDRRLRELDAFVDSLTRADLNAVRAAPQAVAGLTALDPCSDGASLLQGAPLPTDTDFHDRLSTTQARWQAGERAGMSESADALVAEAEALGHAGLIAEACLLAGLVHYFAGDVKRSAALRHEAVNQALLARDDHLFVQALEMLASADDLRLGRFETAHDRLDYAQSVITRMDAPAGMTIELLLARSRIFMAQGEFDDARIAADRANELAESVTEETLAERLERLMAFSQVLTYQGQLDEAVNVHQEVIRLEIERSGPEHPSVGDAHNNLGVARFLGGELNGAAESMATALRIYEAAYGPDHTESAVTRMNLGHVRSAQGHHDEAIDHLERAAKILLPVLGERDPEYLRCLSGLGVAHNLSNHPEEARKAHERARAIRSEVLGPEHPDVAIDIAGMGIAELALDRKSDARELLEHAVALYDRGGADAWDIAEGKLHLAAALIALSEEPARASVLLDEAKWQYEKAGRQRSEARLAELQRLRERLDPAITTSADAGSRSESRPR